MKASDPVRRIEFKYLPLDRLAIGPDTLPKARRMSFFLTTAQVLRQEKTVTRRGVVTWTALKAGDKLVAIEKGQGLKAGDGHTVLALLEVVSVRVEPLDAITADDCAREGFPGITPAEFVTFFTRAKGREGADALARRGGAA